MPSFPPVEVGPVPVDLVERAGLTPGVKYLAQIIAGTDNVFLSDSTSGSDPFTADYSALLSAPVRPGTHALIIEPEDSGAIFALSSGGDTVMVGLTTAPA